MEAVLTDIARIRRHPERAVPEQTADILASGAVAHVGFVEDGMPFVIPFSYAFERDEPRRIYLHGSRASRALKQIAAGAFVCVTVTLLDGLVASRDAKYHSMNYRSVVAFGRGRLVEDEELKARIFQRMVERYFPGRTEGRDYAAATAAQLAATAVVAVDIEAVSAKAREGGPRGPRDQDSR